MQNAPPPTASEILFGIRSPLDDTTRILCDYIYRQLDASPSVNEIELKIGQILSSSSRLHLPVLTECIVSKDHLNQDIRFDSSIPEQCFEAVKEVLNLHIEKMELALQRSHQTATPQNRIQYTHHVDQDEFFQYSDPQSEGHLHRDTSLRITYDAATRQMKQKIVKERVQNVEIWSPQTTHDFRVSINREKDMMHVDETQLRKLSQVRRKDRRSYSFQCFRFDATVVTELHKTLPDGSHPVKYELEMEIDVKGLRYAMDRLKQNPRSLTFANTISEALKLVRACMNVIGQAQRNGYYVEQLRAERQNVMQERHRLSASQAPNGGTVVGNGLTSGAPPPHKTSKEDISSDSTTTSVAPPTSSVAHPTAPRSVIAHPNVPASSTASAPQSAVQHPSATFQSSMPPPNNLKRKRTQ